MEISVIICLQKRIDFKWFYNSFYLKPRLCAIYNIKSDLKIALNKRFKFEIQNKFACYTKQRKMRVTCTVRFLKHVKNTQKQLGNLC